MAAVTICSDFGAQENKVCHCFYCFPIYLPWSDGTGCFPQILSDFLLSGTLNNVWLIPHLILLMYVLPAITKKEKHEEKWGDLSPDRVEPESDILGLILSVTR